MAHRDHATNSHRRLDARWSVGRRNRQFAAPFTPDRLARRPAVGAVRVSFTRSSTIRLAELALAPIQSEATTDGKSTQIDSSQTDDAQPQTEREVGRVVQTANGSAVRGDRDVHLPRLRPYVRARGGARRSSPARSRHRGSIGGCPAQQSDSPGCRGSDGRAPRLTRRRVGRRRRESRSTPPVAVSCRRSAARGRHSRRQRVARRGGQAGRAALTGGGRPRRSSPPARPCVVAFGHSDVGRLSCASSIVSHVGASFVQRVWLWPPG